MQRSFGIVILAGCGFAFAFAQSAAPLAAFEKKPRPAPIPDGRPATLARATESSCNECHAEIVAEWASTVHALAWENELYQDELKDRRKPEACYGCHAPEPLHVTSFDQKPRVRAEQRHFGVSCESCHQAADGAMLGPTGAATDAHVSRRGEAFVGTGSNALCSACHRTTVGPVIGIAKDFESSALPGGGSTCVECHMSVVREVSGVDGLRAVRSHELQTPRDPRFLASSFEITASRSAHGTTVTIANLAGHRVPGMIGREIQFKARGIDAAGKEVAKGELKLDTDSYLPLGENVQIQLDKDPVAVELVGWHVDPRLDEPVRFLELRLSP